jgi:16S rRNA processing protein RimM
MAGSADTPLVVGKLSGVYGVKGWVKVYSFTQPRDNILRYNPWLLQVDGEWRSVRLEDGRAQGKGIVARLEGISDRDQALALRDVEIAIDRSQLESLESGEYYWSDLIGLSVENLRAEPLGRVESLLETGVDDVLVIRGDKERLVPFVQPDIVKSVDLAAGLITVDWELDYLEDG